MTEREKRLAAKGWTRKIVAAEPRLGEIVELHKETGFEVRLEPFDDQERDAGSACVVCFDADRELFKVVYTRPA